MSEEIVLKERHGLSWAWTSTQGMSPPLDASAQHKRWMLEGKPMPDAPLAG